MAGNPRAGNHVTTEANQSLWVTASTDRLLFYCLQKNGMLLQSESDWNTQNTFCFCLSRAHRRFWGCYGWTDQCSNAKLEHFDFPLEFWRSISNIVQQPSSWQSSVSPQSLGSSVVMKSRLSLWFSFLLRLAIFLCDPWCSLFGSSAWLLSYFTPLICLHQTSETQNSKSDLAIFTGYGQLSVAWSQIILI